MVHIQSHVAKLSVHFRHRSHLRNHAIASTCKQASFRTQTSADARTHTHPHTHTHTHIHTHTYTHTHTVPARGIITTIKKQEFGEEVAD